MSRTATTARTISAATPRSYAGATVSVRASSRPSTRTCRPRAIDAVRRRAPELSVDEHEADGIELLADDSDLSDQLLLAGDDFGAPHLDGATRPTISAIVAATPSATWSETW